MKKYFKNNVETSTQLEHTNHDFIYKLDISELFGKIF